MTSLGTYFKSWRMKKKKLYNTVGKHMDFKMLTALTEHMK